METRSKLTTNNASQRMAKARTNLILDYPWFGSLALKLHVEPTDKANVTHAGINTMATNGTNIVYHPPFVDTITDAEIIGVIAHEVLHCALLHPFRRGARDFKKWNIACDYAINQICKDSGLQLPSCGIQPDPKFVGMTADQIYAMLPEPTEDQKKRSEMGQCQDAPKGQKQDKSEGQGEGEGKSKGKPEQGQGQGTGDPQADDEPGMTESDWQIAAKQAEMVATKAGKMPAGLARTLDVSRESKADWRALLKRFIQATQPHDYAWSHPNRRFIGEGLYLPGIVKENMGEFVVAIDTSGSVTAAMLEQFAGEIQEISSTCRPEKIHVVYCDAHVNGSAEFGPDEIVELKMCGGGGTAFQPVFDWVEKQELTPKALIYLTDLEGPNAKEPEYPVLWVTPEWSTRTSPWGEVIRITVDQ